MAGDISHMCIRFPHALLIDVYTHLYQTEVIRIVEGEIHPVLIHRLPDNVADIVGRGEEQRLVRSFRLDALTIDLQRPTW